MTILTIIINLALVALFIYALRKKNLLSIFSNGRWWLTWIAIATITLMDELTSIYYAPYEAYRFIGLKAIFYIAVTSLLIRFVSTRMVEIANILEVNNIKGGGVYSFSYLVLGPSASFIAISSILVTYILTAVLSTVSAIENGLSFLDISGEIKFIGLFAIVWFITFLNIIEIKENAKFTFAILIIATFIIINLIVGGFANLSEHSFSAISTGYKYFVSDFTDFPIHIIYTNVIVGIGSCILAYSGIESVLQTASLTKDWREIKKAYVFLAVTVGIVTPLIALLALSSNIDLSKHETDLIPTFATVTLGNYFGVLISLLAALTLMMAVNTAMVASGELIEKVAERYEYSWLIKVNKKQSLYRIHIINAVFYSILIIITRGSQATLAEMYAVGLVASFCINILSVLIYRYNKGTKQLTYKTSRLGTLILFIILSSTFIYIASHRPYGTLLWFLLTLFFVIAGLKISKTRSPEIDSRKITKTPMDIVFAISEAGADKVHIHFMRWREEIVNDPAKKNNIYVSLYSPRLEEPDNLPANYFWIAIPPRTSLIDMIEGILKTIEYDIPPEIKIAIHFGWPSSSWYDRLSTGVMVYHLMKLPRKYPRFEFYIDKN
ncbi:MAG: APC family permease [Ignavibacteriaceae bacterium]|nr:APC family permease [Ignavibacteriaceae bacterium]